MKKAIALILAFVMLFSVCSVVGFAEDAVETTTAGTEENAVKDSIGSGFDFFDKIINFIYDLFDFLHQQYLIFVTRFTGEDPFDGLFNGDYYEDLYWEDMII